MKSKNNLLKNWFRAFEAISIAAISRDTAARILAVTYVHGNNEELVMNEKYLTEVDHIKTTYHINGGDNPDTELVFLVQKYVKELEEYRNEDAKNATGDAIFTNHAPEWAHKLFMDRYDIKLIN